MRLISYLNPDTKKKINEIKAMRVRLVDTGTTCSNTIDEISKEYNISTDVRNIIDEANKELKTIYKGKYEFAICINEGITPDNIKINKRYIKKIKMTFFDADDKLAKIKRQIENKLKD